MSAVVTMLSNEIESLKLQVKKLNKVYLYLLLWSYYYSDSSWIMIIFYNYVVVSVEAEKSGSLRITEGLHV